ncbi:MAG: AzlD domain-containing protein [Clostridia bacterium]|nr:AzlD domain-containing protein [Clostridia bacterium]
MKVYLYLGVMILTVFLIRALPLTLIRKQIKNRFLRSFLYYVPYVTLAVMTFPAMIDATGSVWAGVAALVVGIVLAYIGVNMFNVAWICCATVFVLELVIRQIGT